ncbi:MAG: hypothetical protein HY929_03895 [Euryarchaeota archaeon]|nr:hypothetical protein [Euryarchaeota archaeon]
MEELVLRAILSISVLIFVAKIIGELRNNRYSHLNDNIDSRTAEMVI